MTKHINHKILSIVEEVKKTQEMIDLHHSGDDPMDEIMERQFIVRKNKLMRELLAEFALSGIQLKNTKGIVQRLANYIEKTEETMFGPNEEHYDLEDVEKLMVG